MIKGDKKKLLILYPYWYPSNLVGVLRVRLIANYLHEFGWEPIILAVDPSFYEEELSNDLLRLVKDGVRVEYVSAQKVYKIRIYGDLALRAFRTLKHRAIEIIRKETIDCLWVPLPPFYSGLIARQIYNVTNVPYVIDYIDPWVHEFPGSNKPFSRARFATLISNLLEPYAVKKVSGLTGVSSLYYLPVIERNKQLKSIPHAAMPYGFDANDYLVKPSNLKLLWSEDGDILPYIYAGAFLPKSHFFIKVLFKCLFKLRKEGILNPKARFYFVGTGNFNLKSIEDYAKEYNINDIVFEKKDRIPYLEVLNNLSNAYGVLAIGSTEIHYTASKIFQSILSQRPLFAVFHFMSSTVEILKEAHANNYLVPYIENESEFDFEFKLTNCLKDYLVLKEGWSPVIENLYSHSARNSAKVLAAVLSRSIEYSATNK